MTDLVSCLHCLLAPSSSIMIRSQSFFTSGPVESLWAADVRLDPSAGLGAGCPVAPPGFGQHREVPAW